MSVVDVVAAPESDAASVFTLLVFNRELVMWFSLIVSEKGEALERIARELASFGLPSRVVPCLEGLGRDGGDILPLIDAPLGIPVEDLPFYCYLE